MVINIIWALGNRMIFLDYEANDVHLRPKCNGDTALCLWISFDIIAGQNVWFSVKKYVWCPGLSIP